jgi:hypothetical protein
VTFALRCSPREYLSVVSHWARQQLRNEAHTPENRRALRKLIEASDALRPQLAAAPETPQNVVRLEEYRRRAS